MVDGKVDGSVEVGLGRMAGSEEPACGEPASITYAEEVATGRTYAISPQIEGVLGYTQEEWMGDADLWIARVHPDDRARVIAVCEQANVEGEPYCAEYRIVARDGHVVWVHDEAALIRDSEGRPLCWEGVMQVIAREG